MTEPVHQPRQLSLTEMQTLIERRPELVEPFGLVKPKLEAGTGQQDLANLIECEVKLRHEGSLHIYSWQGLNGAPYEMRVPKAFDPHPQRSSEPQQQSQAQEAPPKLASEGPTPTETAQELEQRPEVTTGGMFTILAALLGDATMLMTVACTGERDNEPLLTVTVVPEGEGDLSPICLEGTSSELDLHFISALKSRAETKVGLEAQIQALKAADKALEEAKKQEVEAKTKLTETKKKAAQKKTAEAKAEAEAAEKKAESDKQKVDLFS